MRVQLAAIGLVVALAQPHAAWSDWPTLKQLTDAPHGHILANRNCWTHDGQWLLFDRRDDETVFDGYGIERVHVDTGEIDTLFWGPKSVSVGVPTAAPADDRYVFLHSPIDTTWSYAAWHRFGMLGRTSVDDRDASVLDARNITEPLIPGALRGGTHLHTFSPDGKLVASTYEDHLLATTANDNTEQNRRVVAVTQLGRRVETSSASPHNQNGDFTVVVTDVVDTPRPGSDDIARAYSDAWRPDSKSIAFFGLVTTAAGEAIPELFVVDLPDNLSKPGDQPLEGTAIARPRPPAGTRQRRLTDTTETKFPGLSGPRHWPVSSPTGLIGIYKKNDAGRVCFHTVDGAGVIRQVTSGEYEPTSAFTWNHDGSLVTFVADGSVFVINVAAGTSHRLTKKSPAGPRHHACVFSPDGSRIAYMQAVTAGGQTFDQLFVVEVPETLP